MIDAVFYKDARDKYIGFSISGHAGYAKRGKDIVCAAVSALAVNTVNSIDKFTDNTYKIDNASGMIKFKFTSDSDEKGQLLLNALVLGITEIYKEYDGKYLQVYFKEV